MIWLFGYLLALILLLHNVRSLGPKIAASSCNEPYPGINVRMVEAMLEEAFDMAANAASLAGTPTAFWNYRVFHLFRALIGQGQESQNGQMIEGPL